MSRIWNRFFAAGLLALALPACFLYAVTDAEIALMRAAMPDKPVVVPSTPRTMLVFNLSQEFQHSSIPYWAKALDIMAEKTGAFTVEHSTDKAVFSPATLARFDAICFNNTTGLTFNDAQKEALMAFVKGGKGIVGIHAATDNFKGWPEASHMMGGIFQGHPWNDDGTLWAIKIDDPDHPLMASFEGKGFRLRDEIYRTNLPFYSRDKQRVLMSLDMTDPTTRSARGVTPADDDTGISWIKSYGQGRVFYCSLGHNHQVTWTGPILAHYLAGIQYALGDLEVDDSPLGEPAAALNQAELDALVDTIKGYTWGQSRAELTALQAVIRRSLGSPQALGAIEKTMQRLLAKETSLAVKDFACRELSTIGTASSVAALAALLGNPETEHMARYALERIPGEEADKALLAALTDTTPATTTVGILSSLGVRRSPGAARVIGRIATGDDAAAAAAAIQALGIIGSADTSAVLRRLHGTVSPDRRRAVLDAMALCADQLAADGHSSEAMTLYDILYAAEHPAIIRIASLTGISRLDARRFNRLLPAAMASDDPVFQAGAIQLLAEMNNTAVIETAVTAGAELADAAKIQLLAALAANGSPAGRSAAEAALSAGTKEVRMAAYQTLGVVGDAGLVMPLAEAAGKTTDRAEKEAARQALYRLRGGDVAAAIERGIRRTLGAGRDEDTAIELIRAVGERGIGSANAMLFTASRDTSGRVAQEALRTLQTTATAGDVPAMADLLAERPGTAMENTMVATAEKIADRDERGAALLARLKTVETAAAKASFLRVLGRLGDVHAIATIRQMHASPDKTISDAAFRAMADWPGQDFIDLMRETATGSSDETHKVLAFRAYIRMLSSGDGKTDDQIVAALTEAMAMSDRPQERRLVLGAIGGYATPKALSLAQAAMADPELKAEAEAAVLRICERLIVATPDAAATALEQLIEQTANASQKRQAQRLLDRVVGSLGYVTDWAVAGPYTEAGQGGLGLLDKAFAPEQGEAVSWRPMPVFADMERPWMMDLLRVIGGTDRVAYVKTTLRSPRAAEAVFEIGSDDGVKVWLNGAVVHSHAAGSGRALVPGEDKVSVRLKEGDNAVLMKITQGIGDWGFCLRIVTPDGSPMRGLQVNK